MSDDIPPTWLTVPLAARVVLARCRKEEDVSVLRRIPIALPTLSDAEAPVCARLADGDGLRAGEWAYLPYGKGLDWVRHDGGCYLRPLVGFQPRRHLTLDDLEASLAQVREHEHSDWPDWPYSILLKRFSHRKIQTLDFEGMALRHLHTDLDAAALAEATRISGRFVLVGDVLHVRCDEPVNEVRAIGLAGKKITEVVVVPKAGCDEPSRTFGSAECLQIFRADAAGEAIAYAEEMAATLKVPSRVSRAFRTFGAAFQRDEGTALPSEAHARFVGRSQSLVGAFPRGVVEAWLDVRDSGDDPDGLRETFKTLFDLLLQDHSTNRMTILAWFEAYRLLPGVYGRDTGEPEVDEIAPEDVGAFANLD